MELHIHECLEVKDKLLPGQYSIKISIKDRIGGRIIFYHKADSLQQDYSEPVTHDGKFTSKRLQFKSSIFLMAPSSLDLLPSMVYCIQIMDNLGGVVAEGYFPLLNNIFELN